MADYLKRAGFVGGSSPIRDVQAEDKNGYKVNYQNLCAQCYYTLPEYSKGRDVQRDGKLKVIAKDVIAKDEIQVLGANRATAETLSLVAR
jgi:hypothetical protein